MSGSALLRAWKKRLDGAVEHSGNLQQVHRRHIDQSALNPAVVRAVDASKTGSIFLRDAPAFTCFPNLGSDGFERFLVVYTSSIPRQVLHAKPEVSRAVTGLGAQARARPSAPIPPAPTNS